MLLYFRYSPFNIWNILTLKSSSLFICNSHLSGVLYFTCHLYWRGLSILITFPYPCFWLDSVYFWVFKDWFCCMTWVSQFGFPHWQIRIQLLLVYNSDFLVYSLERLERRMSVNDSRSMWEAAMQTWPSDFLSWSWLQCPLMKLGKIIQFSYSKVIFVYTSFLESSLLATLPLSKLSKCGW